MTWKMEVEEIDAVLEKIWDLHDKLSDAIHSISRTHFLHSVKPFLRADSSRKRAVFPDSEDSDNRNGFVFVKGFQFDDSAIREAKSLNSIRTALENLEDQLEFFHTVQIQQRAERDAAVARLEQSRIVLALRLGEHQGKNYKVIEEARAFVGAVRDATNFAPPENIYSAACPSGEDCPPQDEKESNPLFKVLISGLNFVKKTIRVDRLNGIFGNATLVAVSMLALLHLHQHQVSSNRYISHLHLKQEDNLLRKNVTKVSRPEGSSSSGSNHMDVLLARG